ncbi:hypothetical protein PT282_02615 [Bifidobacterium sp. ESL0763]|uniref:hypothetical protein n=1 Tax=Bifidobacterium sp. ESL0763 TaxID=2983227 RepID=UPI0023F8A4A2|nr:hypothetical protein [Bifidobacterium sp. ESL0763]MDF7663564.1 hypothetical protein [Bifidobacterium sp. ESL0763]
MSDILCFEAHGKTHTLYLPNHERATALEADIMANPTAIFPVEIVYGKKTYTIYINPKEWTYWQFTEMKRRSNASQTPIF